MILASKNVLVFAATGAIGSEVARTFAREGARVWVSGRNEAVLKQLVSSIKSEGGEATAEVVDATNSDEVTAYIDRVAEAAGRIDVVFNAIGGRPVDLGYPAFSTTVPFEQFMLPLQVVLGSTFLTSRAVGAHMFKQRSGAIVTLSSTLSGMTASYMAGISAASSAVEGLTRSLAGEFGSAGVRVNCVRGSGMPETRTIQETVAGQINLSGQPPSMSMPPLGRPITVADTAKTAAFLASDLASGMTGQVVTVCAGSFVG